MNSDRRYTLIKAIRDYNDSVVQSSKASQLLHEEAEKERKCYTTLRDLLSLNEYVIFEGTKYSKPNGTYVKLEITEFLGTILDKDPDIYCCSDGENE